MKNALSRRLRARMAFAVLLIPVLLQAVSFARLASWLCRGRPRIGGTSAQFNDADVARWVDDFLRRLPWPWRHTCLKRSAVLFHVLRCAGRSVELRIGVKRDAQGALAAHAWLVKDDALFLESTSNVAAAHKVIARFPESRSAGDSG